jgi:hypothetical protein
MAFLDKLTQASRNWEKLTAKSWEAIQRAASLQAQQYKVHSTIEEARKLALLYAVKQKRMDWREYGDIAFHLIATWPSDLAYIILYAFRELHSELGYDPVPFILKATERIYHLQPENLELHIEVTERVQRLFDDPAGRARMGAKIIAREISITPLRWASGIYNTLDLTVKPFVEEQLREFNPNCADILSNSSLAWLFTGSGWTRWLIRVLFGKAII